MCINNNKSCENLKPVCQKGNGGNELFGAWMVGVYVIPIYQILIARCRAIDFTMHYFSNCVTFVSWEQKIREIGNSGSLHDRDEMSMFQSRF